MTHIGYKTKGLDFFKWMSSFLTAVFVLFITAAGLQAQDFTVHIEPENATLEVGEQVQFDAYLEDSTGTRHDTTLTWSNSNEAVASLSETGLLTATAPGETEVTVTFEDSSATAEVEIVFEGDPDDHYSLTVSPKDTTVVVGSETQFEATLRDTSGAAVDTSISWSLRGNDVGEVDSTGLFSATDAGIGLVAAQVGDLHASATVIVRDSTDTTDLQSVTIIKPRPNPSAPVDTTVIQEGDTYKLSGFPFPFNLLNGGMVHFPLGSLDEDISIKIDLPDFASLRDDTVTFEDDIVTAVSFSVIVEDTVREPYYFNQPVYVSLPYKRGLIHNVLGITPDQLGMFFYDDEGTDTTGISGTFVDSTSNRVFSTAAHFSNLVLAPNETSTPIPDDGNKDVSPTSFELEPNYPNPFNPTTQIAYSLPTDAHVTLEIYDLLGKKVATLVDSRQQSGRHTVQFDATYLSSGIYMYRIKAGSFSAVRKMTLMK